MGEPNLVEMLKTCDDALIDKNIISSFPYIRKTLEHIWGVENGWLKTMSGTPEAFFPEFEENNLVLYSALLEGSKQFAHFGEHLIHEQLTSSFHLQVQDRKYSFLFQ